MLKKHILTTTVAAVLGTLLPTGGAAQDNSQWGIIDVSVCNMRTEGDYDAGMATQGLLGMPVKVLEDSSWMKVQTPEGYLAYVQNRSVYKVSRAQLSQWNSEPQVVVTALWGKVTSEPKDDAQIVGDVVMTDRLKLTGTKGKYFKVAFPDGRTGYLSKKVAQELGEWRSHLSHDVSDILATARTLIGIPYMWGGMSSKGMDCSGFVRTVLLAHDIIIPRDASQMAVKGQHIDIAPDFANLQPGDLLFFGKKATDSTKARVSHVGFYLGNKKFIHSLGMVQIASFNPADADYDAYDLGRLLWAQRVLPYINKEEGLFTTDKSDIYK